MIMVPDIRSRPNRVERVHKTEGLIAPRPEDGASGPPKFQPIGREDEKTWELNPFPFPRYVRTMIHRAKPVSRNSFGKYPEEAKS